MHAVHGGWFTDESLYANICSIRVDVQGSSGMSATERYANGYVVQQQRH